MDRNELIVSAKDGGETFRSIAKRYGLSAGYVGTVYYRTKYRMEHPIPPRWADKFGVSLANALLRGGIDSDDKLRVRLESGGIPEIGKVRLNILRDYLGIPKPEDGREKAIARAIAYLSKHGYKVTKV